MHIVYKNVTMSIVGRQKSSKLNQILLLCPQGALAPTSWLVKNGISRQLLDRYEEYSWVTRATKGVVYRSGDKPTWQGAIYALQTFLKLNVWIGGKTALELRGFAHFVPMAKIPMIHLYSCDVTRLPKWVTHLFDVAEFSFYKTALFQDNFSESTFSDHKLEKMSLKISSPERAIFELLEQVPTKQTFEEAELIFESLTTLRPKVVQLLLNSCTSFKVKRLFLYLAEKSKHDWFSKLELANIDLGKGKRSIAINGELNKKYQIVVPRNK